MAINDLIGLIPPPTEPRDATGDWDAVQASLGVQYPNDFQQMIKQYGTGEFFSGLVVLNPFNSWCFQEIPKQLKNFRIMRDAMELSWAIHPERRGLFPWGFDTNGNKFCWLTEGKPDQWPVVQLRHNEEDTPHRSDATITEFLVNYSQNKYPKMLGGIKFKKGELKFTPGLVWQ